jgi:AcrR family transcriptional regulator
MSPPVSAPSVSSVLTPRQSRVANALAKGATITQAAAAAGLHRGTIYKWLNTNKQFQEAVGDARDAYRQALRKELQDLSNTVFATLRSLLTDPKTTLAERQRLAVAYLARWQFADARLDGIPPAECPNPAGAPEKATKGDAM